MHTHTEIHRERVLFCPYSALVRKSADKLELLAPLCRRGKSRHRRFKQLAPGHTQSPHPRLRFRKRNPLVLLVLQFLAPPCSRTRTQGQSGPEKGGKVKDLADPARALHRRARTGAKKSGFPVGIPGRPQEFPILNQLDFFIYITWSGAQEGHRQDPKLTTALTL